jgi:hypothetical protein
MIPYAKPKAALADLPQQLRDQIEPYLEYFDKKFKEIDLKKIAPLELDENDRLKLEPSERDPILDPGTYATGSFKNGKRAIMLGTVIGTVAMYESNDVIDVPESVRADGKLPIPSFKLHASPVFWEAGLLKLTMFGKIDLSTFIDLLGYTKQDGRDDHNRNNVANRLERVAKALDANPIRATRQTLLAALPKECSKIYGDYERGYNKALGHVHQSLSAVLKQPQDSNAENALMIDNAVEAAALLCDQAVEQSEAESAHCLPHEFIEKAVFRGAIAQAAKLAAGIRALKLGPRQASDPKDSEAHF